MKTILTILSASLCITAGAMDRFSALSMIETANNDFTCGQIDRVGKIAAKEVRGKL